MASKPLAILPESIHATGSALFMASPVEIFPVSERFSVDTQHLHDNALK